ncbi:hypothetical protein IWX85_000986 [Polaromonas sp. CG_9.11]|nr:hypothetical protein [Polaromonas sp. CG_9.11]
MRSINADYFRFNEPDGVSSQSVGSKLNLYSVFFLWSAWLVRRVANNVFCSVGQSQQQFAVRPERYAHGQVAALMHQKISQNMNSASLNPASNPEKRHHKRSRRHRS